MNERGCPPDYNGGFCADYDVDCKACWEQWKQEHKAKKGQIMTGYIEREKAIEAFDDPAVERYYGDVCPESIISVIEQIPAANVRPVVQGRWITRPYMIGNTQYCSLCGENYGMKYNFCPNCGADMRDPQKEE